ncbi:MULTISPECIES: hypothetical protein [Paraburkholderia]|uniref:Uncharacterized protein n=1 Tax=Paraburkholderia acidicola TaxID=1912599 RepID=A0ABV1LYH2_9BURK
MFLFISIAPSTTCYACLRLARLILGKFRPRRERQRTQEKATIPVRVDDDRPLQQQLYVWIGHPLRRGLLAFQSGFADESFRGKRLNFADREKVKSADDKAGENSEDGNSHGIGREGVGQQVQRACSDACRRDATHQDCYGTESSCVKAPLARKVELH